MRLDVVYKTDYKMLTGGNFMKKIKNSLSRKLSKGVALSLVSALCFGVFGTMPKVKAAELPEEEPVMILEETGDDGNTTIIEIYKVSDEPEDYTTYASGDTIHQKGGVIAPGETITGTFSLTKLLGTDFTAYFAAGGSSSDGSLKVGFVSAAYTVQCGSSVVLARESGWGKGTYAYSITSNASKTVGYSLQIIEN